MKKLIRLLTPPQEWVVPGTIITGALVGLTLYAFIESKAVSYLSDNPRTCVNCHVMTPQYATWQNSSHREWATCNDCHVPQGNFMKTYAFKARDGFNHSRSFLLRNEPEVIRMKEAGVEVVRQNCIRCHENQVTDARLDGLIADHKENRTDRNCWECHQEVPHGKANSLSTVRYLGKVPIEHQNTLPDWLEKYTNINTDKN